MPVVYDLTVVTDPDMWAVTVRLSREPAGSAAAYRFGVSAARRRTPTAVLVRSGPRTPVAMIVVDVVEGDRGVPDPSAEAGWDPDDCPSTGRGGGDGGDRTEGDDGDGGGADEVLEACAAMRARALRRLVDVHLDRIGAAVLAAYPTAATVEVDRGDGGGYIGLLAVRDRRGMCWRPWTIRSGARSARSTSSSARISVGSSLSPDPRTVGQVCACCPCPSAPSGRRR